jgi:purine-binding chemotaxis protein CheW
MRGVFTHDSCRMTHDVQKGDHIMQEIPSVAMPSTPPTAQPYSRRGREDEVKVAQLIIFHLGDEEFAAKIAEVREIIKTGAITPIPDAPDFIKGIINVRGDIVVTIDPKTLFSLAENDVACKHVVITEQEKNIFGLMVDEVTEVMRIPETEIKPPPELLTALREEYVRGVVTLENRLIILLDLSRVLSDDELQRLSEVRKMQKIASTEMSKEESKEVSKQKRVKKGNL